MSKVLIVSDSHGLTEELQLIKDTHGTDIDLMVHCGDSELMKDDPAIQGFLTVRGNCDYEAGYPNETTADAGGKKFFITHGHHYSVKSTLMNLHYRAKEVGADVVCFGHSHLLGAEEVDGILFLNPGSLRLPRRRLEKTYVILDLQEKDIVLKVFDLENGELKELSKKFTLSK
ncbi:metallophosphoesterase [Neobacillus terrae]|uniref:metallophosphoesterase n=1 Tax=Neobacillus terrae TaxID=3034837 RepID=UPI00140993A9|nr:metallophosphoesterase [Neobacillus terrae]NHM30508.1 metallophosphoesterase [Neobacillus terrae]